MKLWEKDLPLDKQVEEFTIGKDAELDMLLARYDVLGSMAHAKMLASVEIISDTERDDLLRELSALLKQIVDGTFQIEAGVEDIHSQVELELTNSLGETGKRIHSARSRNDQVLLDLKLFFRDEVRTIVQSIEKLVALLLSLSEKHKDDLLPGYTHLQAAMPSSFGLWFGAYAESLIDDLRQWTATYATINQNPLGSAAGYGSSLPIDREMTTRLLGFPTMHYNVVNAQMARGKGELSLAFGLAATANTLSKMAMDICLYNSQNFGFITLPADFTTGSSIMPHKKNPDVFELIRARCNQMQQLPGTVAGMTGSLPSGYHRDLQLLKELIFPPLQHMKGCLEMLLLSLPKMEIRSDIMKDDRYALTFSVERVNELVVGGTPFREAYQQVAKEIEGGTFRAKENLSHTHEGSLGNLQTEAIATKLAQVMGQFDFGYVEVMEELAVGNRDET